MKCVQCGKLKKGTYKDLCPNCYNKNRYWQSEEIRESRKELTKKWQREHPEDCKDQKKKWIKNNPTYYRDYQRKKRKIDPSNFRKKYKPRKVKI